MRITAAVAALAVALASSGCVTGALLSLAGSDQKAHDEYDGPIIVGGLLVDGVVMTSLGAGALDGHSSVGWSRTEGEWAMAGGITLLVIDAVVIAILAGQDHDEPAPLGPPPPGTLWVTIHADTIDDYARLAHLDPGPLDSHLDAEVGDQPIAIAPGTYRLCVRYAHRDYGRDVRLIPAAYVACTTAIVDGAHREVTMPPPLPVTSPR